MPQGISLDDANDLTPEIKALAQEQLKRFRLGPLFTPPSLARNACSGRRRSARQLGRRGVRPGDRACCSSRSSDTLPRQLASARTIGRTRSSTWEYSNYCGQAGLFTSRGPQGTNASLPRGAAGACQGPDTVNYSGGELARSPLTKPPYALPRRDRLEPGDIAWQVPFGEGSQAIRQHPLLKGVALPDRLGTDGRPGPIVTSGGLVFIGGGDPYLYAFDATTGQEIRRVPTPFRTSGNPMTYRTRSGRQFVVIATGSGPDATLAAFALRDSRTTGAAPVRRSRRRGPPCRQRRRSRASVSRVTAPVGTGGFAPSLVPMARSAAEVRAIVREGIGQMPPVSAGELTDEEVQGVYQYLRGASR